MYKKIFDKSTYSCFFKNNIPLKLAKMKQIPTLILVVDIHKNLYKYLYIEDPYI